MAMVGGLVRGGGGRGIAGRGVHTHCRLFGLLLFFWGGGGRRGGAFPGHTTSGADLFLQFVHRV